ncbi:hypothetical protein IT41_12655 [Paracoccus halophilus]|uniref:DUF5666 domain-containing protein n=1 Tax=Paracoccus halophilus TaxID=376733 RepID=A0A099EZW2_9RHOB|nr:hypothetical protein IT41_12655 [Paracoccus halophilus]
MITLTSVDFAAAEPQSTRIRGTIESYEPGALRVLTRERELVAVAVPENLQVVSLASKEISDIGSGDLVSASAVPNEEGGLTALQVSILPPNAGLPVGRGPNDLAPDSVMVTATISGTAASAEGDKLTMSYEGESVVLTVPEGVPVVTFGMGDTSLLSEGATIFAIAQVAEDGTFSTNRVIAETNGVKPPM